ncbi:MAG: hypothetical protein ACR2G2_11855 [Pseudonocardia sp.]
MFLVLVDGASARANSSSINPARAASSRNPFGSERIRPVRLQPGFVELTQLLELVEQPPDHGQLRLDDPPFELAWAHWLAG